MNLKIAITGLLLTLSLSAFAVERPTLPMKKQVLAEVVFGLDDVSGQDEEIKYLLKRYVIQVRADQTLRVTESTYAASNRWMVGNDENQIGEDDIVVKKLHKQVYAELKRDIAQLANAEIVTTFSQIVCRMMPTWSMRMNELKVARQYNTETETFTGDLELVDGAHGCWVSKHTHPKEEYLHQVAVDLKKTVRLLSL